MATEIALSSGQLGVSPRPGMGVEGLFTLTPGTTATAGEAITDELSPYFSKIHSIEVGGVSAAALMGYKPVFQFTAGSLLSAAAVTLFWYVQDGDAGALVADNETDLSAVGTLQIRVVGDPA